VDFCIAPIKQLAVHPDFTVAVVIGAIHGQTPSYFAFVSRLCPFRT
jgi:hypothetical protein